MHLEDLLGFNPLPTEKHLSSRISQENIKKYLIGNNITVKTLGHLKKTTPPTLNSGFIDLADSKNIIFKNYSVVKGNTFLSIVGTYQSDGIGTSCYHNNLSIFENILSHTLDRSNFMLQIWYLVLMPLQDNYMPTLIY